MLGNYGLKEEFKDLYRATPAVTRGLGFCGLIQRAALFSHLLEQERCTEAFLYRNRIGVVKISKAFIYVFFADMYAHVSYP